MRKLTSEEVEMLICEGGGEVDGCEWEEMEEISGGRRRWSVETTTVFSSPDLGFVSLEWNKAATECQEHEFWAQTPKKVERVPVTAYVWKEVSE